MKNLKSPRVETYIIVQNAHATSEKQKVKVGCNVFQLSRLDIPIQRFSILYDRSSSVLDRKVLGRVEHGRGVNWEAVCSLYRDKARAEMSHSAMYALTLEGKKSR